MDTILSIGDKLEITKIKTNMLEKLGQDKHRYICKIIDVISETSVKITIPIRGGKLIPLEVEATYDVCFFVKNNLYGCEATVTSRGKEGKIHYAIIDFLTKLDKIQRREFYRLPIFYEFRIADESEEEIEWRDATLLDISGGGMKFISKKRYEKDQVLTCKLPMISLEKQGIKGKVIASYYHNEDKLNYETRLVYDDIKPQTREHIIRFIFEEERRQRAKK